MNLVSTVPLNDIFPHHTGVQRAGVIPYSTINNEIYWLMGMSHNQRLGDFGGGCRNTETPFQCLLREVNEESSGLLTEIIRNAINMRNGIYVWRTRSRRDPPIYRYLLFVPIPYDERYINYFRSNSEVRYLRWVRQAEVLDPQVPLDTFLTPLHQYIRYFRRFNS